MVVPNSSGVEKFLRPVGFTLNFPLPMITPQSRTRKKKKNSGHSPPPTTRSHHLNDAQLPPAASINRPWGGGPALQYFFHQGAKC
ncbi:hypothetical protein BHM03_00014864 [Ensete ventricosum]|nr:hypothetical protein BHM03_00014864 [Ensete ventricosum]